MVKYAVALDDVFGALADPTRRAILTRLSRGPAPMRQIAERFRMSWPAITKHVKVLERAHLVRREHDGREHRIHLSATPMLSARSWLDDYRQFWEERLDALEHYLADSTDSDRRRTRKP